MLPRLPRRLLMPGLAALALARAGAADRPWVLPPLDGDLAGEVTPLLLPGAPPLTWTLSVRSHRPRERAVALTVSGPGLELRGGAVLDPRADGTWRVESLQVDLAEWFGWLAPRLAPAADLWGMTGRLEVRGEGTWRAGVLAGTAEIDLREGRFEDPTRKLVVEGLAANLRVADLRMRRTEAAQVITWRSGKFDTVAFGPGRIEGTLDGAVLRLSSAKVQVLGGEVEVGAFEWSSASARLTINAQVRGVDLGQLLFLLPPVLSTAHGRLDGRVAFQYDGAGVQLGIGNLSLRQAQTAELRFAPSPGLLSSQLPAAVRGHYPGLLQLETGGVPLRAEVLEVTLTPAGDTEGRTATVRIEGGPVDPTLKAPVVLQVNVRGPLDSLVKFGTNSRVGRGGGR